MTPRTFETLKGLKFTVDVPTSADEFDKLAGAPGTCLEEAIKNTAYRGLFADVRGSLVDHLVATTGKERKTKDHPKGLKYKADQKDESGKITAKSGDPIQVPDETEEEYVLRVAAEEGKDVSAYQSVLDELMQKKDETGAPVIRFDPSQTERKAPTSAGPLKSDIAAATSIIAAPEEKRNVAIARMQATLGMTYTIDAVKCASDVNELAKAYRAYRLELAKQASDSLLK